MLDRLQSDVAHVAAVIWGLRGLHAGARPGERQRVVDDAVEVVVEAYARVFAGGIHERIARRTADLQRAADLAKAAELNAAIVDPGQGEGVGSP